MKKTIKNLIEVIRWYFSKRRWEVIYNVGTKQLGVRKIKYFGKIIGVDWSNYKTKVVFTTSCTIKDLQKLKTDIEVILQNNLTKNQN